MPANSTVTVQLEDAASAAAAAPKGGSIAGTVVEGGRGQPGLEVRLLDDKGAVKDAVKTDAKGAYIFKEVVAGSYRVASTKTVDSTKGETAALVLDGKNQVGVDINLQRRDDTDLSSPSPKRERGKRIPALALRAGTIPA